MLVAFLAPLLVFPLIPAPPPGKLAASGNFSRFAREAAFLLKRREVFLALPLLMLLSASFACTSLRSLYLCVGFLVDPRSYDWLGITGAFLADARVSAAACILLTIVLRRQLSPAPPVAELA